MRGRHPLADPLSQPLANHPTAGVKGRYCPVRSLALMCVWLLSRLRILHRIGIKSGSPVDKLLQMHANCSH